MSDNTVIVVVVVVVVFAACMMLTVGDPNIIDAIIYRMMNP